MASSSGNNTNRVLPGDKHGPRHRRPPEPFPRLLGLLRPFRRRLTAAITFGVVGIVLSTVGPLLLGKVTDVIADGVLGDDQHGRGGHGIDFGLFTELLAELLAVYAATSLFTLLQRRAVASVVQEAVFGLRESVADKLARLPLSYFDRNRPGEVLSRATNDVDNLQQTLQQTFAELITSVFSILSMLTMMLVISPALALIMVGSVPVSIVLVAFISKKAQPQFASQWESSGKLNAHVEETYTAHSLVKGFDRRRLATERFDEHSDALATSGARAQFISGTIEPAMMCIGNLGYVAVAVVGAWKVVSGALTIGDVQAFILYSRQFSQPIVEAASISGRFQSGVASAKRIFHLLDAREQRPDPARPATLPTVRGRVELDHVSFHYTTENRLIQGLSLDVTPGQTVAIVGPTGAGKSTLGNLLMRFYELDGGHIRLDGVDIARMSRDDLRSKFGLVPQDTWLFSGTIAENIAYGRADATREDVIAAAKATYADRFIRTLPDGYDTLLDDETSSLSAGEKQLLTVARAFLAKPSVLVLDEATSSVDTRTEVLIQRAMNTLREGRTSFVIAHRLSTIRDAGLILVMDSGQIVESGTHDELLAHGGFYAAMHASREIASPPSSSSGPASAEVVGAAEV
jgi:ATP-binding cassette subfamily B multidrug efflux pump